MRKFTMHVQLYGSQAEGVGVTKKVAKAEAARKLYAQIRCRERGIDYKPEDTEKIAIGALKAMNVAVIKTDQPDATNRSNSSTAELNAKIDRLVVTDTSQVPLETKNIVQQLMQICKINGLSAPEYEQIGTMTGEAHDPQYTFHCTIKNVESVAMGKGRSKQIAKREAALAMWNHLQNKDNIKEVAVVHSPPAPRKQTTVITANPPDLTTKVQFFEQIETSLIKIIQQVQGSVSTNDQSQILKAVAEELGAKVRYSPINSEANVEGVASHFKYIIELVSKDNNVLLTSYGRSLMNTEVAMQQAANRALDMLGIMALKSSDLHSD